MASFGPRNCRNYPFDAVDSEIDQCGYTFERVLKSKWKRFAELAR